MANMGTSVVRKMMLRVRAYALVWVMPVLVLLLLGAVGVVTAHTSLPAVVASALNAPLDTGAIMYGMGLSMAALLLALGCGATASARVLAEDMASLLYLAGTFSIEFIPAVSYVLRKQVAEVSALFPDCIGIGIAGILCGMFIQGLGELFAAGRDRVKVLPTLRRWLCKCWRALRAACMR